ARVHVAEDEIPRYPSSQSAPDAELRAGDPDRAGEEGLREVTRLRPAVVRVPGCRACAAVLVPAPAEVAALHDQVDLVVATRSVLRLPEPPGLGVEGEAERVAVTERPDPAVRVARGAGTVPVEPEDLPAEVVREILCVRIVVGITDDQEELPVRAEQE